MLKLRCDKQDLGLEFSEEVPSEYGLRLNSTDSCGNDLWEQGSKGWQKNERGKEAMPRGEVDRIAELEGAMKAKEDELSRLRGKLAEQEKQLDEQKESNSGLFREIGRITEQHKFLTSEREDLDKRLKAAREETFKKGEKLAAVEEHASDLETRDPAEKARLEREHQAAARREKEDAAKAEERATAWKQGRVSLITLAMVVAVFGALYVWGDKEFDLWTYVGTCVLIPAVVGLFAQLADHLERGLDWLKQGNRGLAACGVIGATIGALVAFSGIGGEGWMMWLFRLMTFLGYGGYIFLGYYFLWRIPKARSKWWGLLPLMTFLMVVSVFGAFIYHPVSREWMGIEAIFDNKVIATPMEYLVNVGLWLVIWVLITGLAALIAAPGLVLFQRKLGRIHEKRRQGNRWMFFARIIIFVAAIVVAWLMARSLWPADGELDKKVLSIAVGLITFVGFSWLKSRLFYLMNEGRPYVRVLTMSIFVVFCTSLISGSVFYEANSEEDRLLNLKTEIGALQKKYYNAAKPVAERYALAATDAKAKKAYEACVTDMDNSMKETQVATNYNEIKKANEAFGKAGALVATRLDKQHLDLLDKVNVPKKTSTMNLYTSSIGNLFGSVSKSELPEGVEEVEEVYIGALVMSALMLFMMEFMVLIVFFAMVRSKGEAPPAPQHDGWVVGRLYDNGTVEEAVRRIVQVAQAAAEVAQAAIVAQAAAAQPAPATPTGAVPPDTDTLSQPPPPANPDNEDKDDNEQGTQFLVACARGTEVGDQLDVLGKGGKTIAVLRVSVQLGDEVFLCERHVAKGMKPIPNRSMVHLV